MVGSVLKRLTLKGPSLSKWGKADVQFNWLAQPHRWRIVGLWGLIKENTREKYFLFSKCWWVCGWLVAMGEMWGVPRFLSISHGKLVCQNSRELILSIRHAELDRHKTQEITLSGEGFGFWLEMGATDWLRLSKLPCGCGIYYLKQSTNQIFFFVCRLITIKMKIT